MESIHRKWSLLIIRIPIFIRMTSLAVLGVGKIGGEVANLAAVLGIVDELVLYDSASELLRAQALDIRHTGLDITITTETKRIRDTDVCIFSAGLPRNPSIKTRADLLDANLGTLRDCGSLLNGYSGVLVTVTNPMDTNNFYLCKMTGIDRERCIGFGGQLDSARFKSALASRGIRSPGFVIGEHGEHQVPVFSQLKKPVSSDMREEILSELRGASMEVIKGKGGTVFGPAFHLASLVRMLVRNNQELITCSAVLEGEYGVSGCSLGVPVRIGRGGIRAIEEWDLDDWEAAKMQEAGTFAQELCRHVTS
jgi:malate dehydrogenase